MTEHDDLDRMLSAWLDDPYTPPAPRYLTKVLDRTRRTRQRPAWANLERWLPMAEDIKGSATTPPMRMGRLLLIVLLVVALVGAAAFVGSRLLSTAEPAIPIPQGGAAVLAYASIVGDSGDIFTVRADGTETRQLTSGPAAKSAPAFSPDGRRIAYREWGGGEDLIVVMDAGGGNRTILSTNSSIASYCARGGLSWSPDGSSLIFRVSSECDLRYDLYVVPADGSAPPTKLLAPGIDSAHAAWSPDGTKIAVVGGEPAGGLGVYVVDVGQGGALSGGLTARRIGTAGGDQANSGPATWSPDGTQLLFASEAGDVAVVAADGSGSRVLAAKAYNPRWSPDGRHVAFHRTVDPSEYIDGAVCTARIWIVDVDGTNERRLDDLGNGCDAPPLWSPDGTRISASLTAKTDAQASLQPHLGIITVDGSGPTVILRDAPGVSWQPVAAPLPPAPSFSAAP